MYRTGTCSLHTVAFSPAGRYKQEVPLAVSDSPPAQSSVTPLFSILAHSCPCGGHIGFTGILSFYGSLPRFQLEDCSDQTAQWIDFKFADYVDHTQI
jgi:hypothetical protein